MGPGSSAKANRETSFGRARVARHKPQTNPRLKSDSWRYSLSTNGMNAPLSQVRSLESTSLWDGLEEVGSGDSFRGFGGIPGASFGVEQLQRTRVSAGLRLQVSSP